MTAKAKIETLTNGWYGFAVFVTAASLLENGIGLFSLAGAAFGLFFSFFLTWFLGRRLLARSSLTRIVLVVLSGLSTVLGTLGVARVGWAFLQTWHFGLIVTIAIGVISVWMNARSFRVLTDPQVKAYCA